MNSADDGQLDAALASLVEDGTLSDSQAAAVRQRVTTGTTARHVPRARQTQPARGSEPDRPWTTILSEVGGYVGAAFVFAAAVALTGPNWDRLPNGSRFAILAGPAFLMLVSAAAVAISTPGRWSAHDQHVAGPRRRLISALVLVAALLAAGAAAVLTTDFEPVAVTLTALVILLCGYLLCRTPLLHVATAVALTCSVISVYDQVFPLRTDATVVGALVVGVGLVWAALAYFRLLDEHALGLIVGGLIVLGGAEAMAIDEDAGQFVGYLVMAVLAVAALAGYIALRQVGLLVLGTVTLAIVVPQAVIDFSDGALGAAGALLVTGLSIVGASVLGLRLRRSEPDDTAPGPVSVGANHA